MEQSSQNSVILSLFNETGKATLETGTMIFL